MVYQNAPIAPHSCDMSHFRGFLLPQGGGQTPPSGHHLALRALGLPPLQLPGPLSPPPHIPAAATLLLLGPGPLSLPHEDTGRSRPPTSEEEGSHGALSRLHLDLGLLSSQNYEETHFGCQNHSVCGVLSPRPLWLRRAGLSAPPQHLQNAGRRSTVWSPSGKPHVPQGSGPRPGDPLAQRQLILQPRLPPPLGLGASRKQGAWMGPRDPGWLESR